MESSRPPIVTILGHVDHGKTTLLDYIRQANVASREVGGITQHIGAYTVGGITFIDTPGHETFKEMRSRGAKVADIAVLVIAGNEGIKPQTRESLKLIREEEIPFIVAITKIDLPTTDIESVKAQLESEAVKLEGKGGDVIVVPVSGKTGKGVDHLLEMISLVGEMAQLKADTERPLEAVVIESGSDARRGPSGTVVVREGKIVVGDKIVAENTQAKVKIITDELGRQQKELLPGFAGQILGFEKTPPIGGRVYKEKMLNGRLASEVSTLQVQPKEEGKLNLIVKADTAGTLEALTASLPPGTSILSSGIGEVNQNDVMMATTFNAPIIAFQVKFPPDIEKMAKDEGIVIGKFFIIYEAVLWVEELTKPKVSPVGAVLGRAVIIAEFPYGEKGKIAGIKVDEGRITKNDKVELVRGDARLGVVRISSIQQGPKTVDKVDKGQECGILFTRKVDFKIGDVLECTR